MRKVWPIITVAMSLALCACAITPMKLYAPSKTPRGLGYSEQPISLTQYYVTFRAPRTAGQKATEDLALLRAAEFTQGKGRAWFKLLQRDTAMVEVPRPKVVTTNPVPQNMT